MPNEEQRPLHPKQELLKTHIESVVKKRGSPPSLAPVLTEAKKIGLITADVTPEEAVRIASIVVVTAAMTEEGWRRYVPTEAQLEAFNAEQNKGEENAGG